VAVSSILNERAALRERNNVEPVAVPFRPGGRTQKGRPVLVGRSGCPIERSGWPEPARRPR
jgi:hypothetical protein